MRCPECGYILNNNGICEKCNYNSNSVSKLSSNKDYEDILMLSENLLQIESINKKINSQKAAQQALNKRKIPFTLEAPERLNFLVDSGKVSKTIIEEQRALQKKATNKKGNAITAKYIIIGALISIPIILLTIFVFMRGAANLFLDNWWVLFIDQSEELSLGTYLFTLALVPCAIGVLLILSYNFIWIKSLDISQLVIGIIYLVISGGLLIATLIVAGWGFIPWILGYFTLGIGQFAILGVLVMLSFAPIFSVPFIIIALYEKGDDKSFDIKQKNTFSLTDAQSHIYKDPRYLRAYDKDLSLADKRRSEYRKHYNAILTSVNQFNSTIDRELAKIPPTINNLVALRTDVQRKIDAYNGLHRDEKNLAVAYKVLYLFQHRRADTLKEALILMDTEDFRQKVLQGFDSMINLLYKLKEQMYAQNVALATEIKRTRIDLSTRMSSIERTIETTAKETQAAIDSVGNSIYSSLSGVESAIKNMSIPSTTVVSYDTVYQERVLNQLGQIRNAL